MSDMGDDFREWKKRSQRKRESNRATSANILEANRIPFEVKNGGAHLIVGGGPCLIDFWPGTGKFIGRDGKTSGRGVRNLIKAMKT